MIGCGHQVDHWLFALPGHGLGKLDDGLHAVSHIPIPVGLQDTPTAFDRIVFAVIRGIRGQCDRQLRRLGKGHEPFEKLSTMALILGPVIQVGIVNLINSVDESSPLSCHLWEKKPPFARQIVS